MNRAFGMKNVRTWGHGPRVLAAMGVTGAKSPGSGDDCDVSIFIVMMRWHELARRDAISHYVKPGFFGVTKKSSEARTRQLRHGLKTQIGRT